MPGMDDSKVTHLKPVTTSDPSKMEAAAELLRRERRVIYRYNAEMAIIIRNEYEEYVRAGFTPKQAMQLVTAKITPPAK